MHAINSFAVYTSSLFFEEQGGIILSSR